jgi:hypothetical protein
MLKIIKLNANEKTQFIIINTIINLALFFSIEPGRSISSWGLTVWFVFFFFQFVFWGFLITKKNFSILYILFYNLYFILILNFLFTPLLSKYKNYPSLSKNTSIKFQINDKEMYGFDDSISVVTTDNKGFRTNKKIDYDLKPKNTLRLAVVGASQAEEIYIDDNKIWSNLLGKKIEINSNFNIEIINTGVSGSGVDEHLKTMQYLVSLKNIDHFIFIFGQNDWNKYLFKNNLNYLNSFFYYFSFKDSLLMKLFTFINFEIFTKKINTIKIIDERYGKNQSNSLSNRTASNNKLIEIPYEYKTKVLKIFELCKINELKCTFLESFNAYKKNVDVNIKNNFWMTPPNVQYSLSLNDLIYVSELFNNWLKIEVNRNKFNFCNVGNNLEPSKFFFYDDAHLNPNGSRKLSEIIFKCIKDNLK